MDSEKLRELLDEDEKNGGVDVNYRQYVDYEDDIDDEEELYSENDEKADDNSHENIKIPDYSDKKTDLSVLNEPEKKKNTKLKNKLKPVGIAGIFLLAALITIYICISYVLYSNRFVPSTVINGFNCSNKTVNAVFDEVNSSLDNYSLSIMVGGINSDTIYGSDIELACGDDLKARLTDICNNQKKYSWLKGFFAKSDEIYIDNGLQLNYDTLDEILDKSVVFGITPTIKSEDAGIIYNGEEFELKPAIYGDEIDRTVVRELVIRKIQCLDDTLDIDTEKCYVQPAITEQDEKLDSACEIANRYIDKSITLKIFDTTQILDKSVLNKWVTVNFNADVVANEDEIKDYVKSLDDKYTTLNKLRTFKTHYGDSVTVSGGDYGRKLDSDLLNEQLAEAVLGFDDEEITAEFTSGAMGPVGNDIGTSYIEIDLTNQKLWMYKNGRQIVETDVVTGKNDGKHNTPQGTYKIKDKKRNTTIKGESHTQPVSYFVQFNDNMGISDAPWQTEFGGTTYILNGSNGSVGVPSDVAATIYNNAVKDMAVVCYFHSVVAAPVDAVAPAPSSAPVITMPEITYPSVSDNKAENETYVEVFTEDNSADTQTDKSEEATAVQNPAPAEEPPAVAEGDGIIHEETVSAAE